MSESMMLQAMDAKFKKPVSRRDSVAGEDKMERSIAIKKKIKLYID